MNGYKISYPSKETWFIIWNDLRTEIVSRGSVKPTQCLGSKYSEIDTYDNEEDFNSVLEINKDKIAIFKILKNHENKMFPYNK